MSLGAAAHAAASRPAAACPRAAASGAMRGSVRCRAASVTDIARQVAAGERSAREVVAEYLARATAAEPALNAFVALDPAGALAQADALDAARARGEPLGALAGVPVAVKDNLCTRGLATTAGSRALAGYVPPYDAGAVERLRAAGAVVIGKANMDEFGMGSSTESSAAGPTRNPWDVGRVPGGSSGGSAAAVAANQCAAALGSDTGGSIRQPAHFCGVIGVKPTYGRVSRSGLVAYASSLDCVGPLARSVADAAALLSAIAGPDAADATCSARAGEDYGAGLRPLAALGDAPLAGRRLALIRECAGAGVAPGVAAAVARAADHLRALGAEVSEVSLPSFALGLPAYYVIALSEASSNLARYDGVRYGPRAAGAAELREMYDATRGAGLGPEVRRRILSGTYALSAGQRGAFYERAQRVRTLIQRELAAALRGHDVLLAPGAPTTAYALGEKAADPLAMWAGDVMTVNVNLAGLPAVAVPCGFAAPEGGGAPLPVGLQMIGRPFGEAALLELAHVFELTAADFASGRPAVYAE
jgi:aspartyl-tRNA(Asn)/glutamyl-tRNA(Gln) amidotransferase subunit A